MLENGDQDYFKMKNEFKEDKNSMIEITRVTDQFRDQNGITHKTIRKTILTNPLSFGSLNNPKNKDIVSVKCIKRPQSNFDISSFFRM